jgi:hypothetical protein
MHQAGDVDAGGTSSGSANLVRREARVAGTVRGS